MMSAGVRSSRRARLARGFSLIELMVVIIIIGIVSALAVPTMLAARTDRHAYDDAGQIMQFFREARTRAVARGGAVLISMTMGGTADRGTFAMYESVTVNPGAGGGSNRTPVSSCKTPTVWVPLNPAGNAGIVQVDALNLNGTIEAQANIQTQLNVYSTAVPTQPGMPAYLCFTPLGHTYFAATTPVFDGALPIVTPIEFRVTTASGGTVRSVLVPPNGMARLFSHVP